MFRPKDFFGFHGKETLQNWYTSIRFSWKEFFSYYSTWAIVCFFIPFQNRLFQLMKFHMILHASLGGAYISYIYPKILHVNYMNIILDGFLLQVVDFFAHQVFLIFLCQYQNRPIMCNLVEFCIVNTPLVIYLCHFNVGYRYGLRIRDMLFLLVLYIFFLFFFA